MEEANRYGRYAPLVQRLFQTTGRPGLELSQSNGETLCVLIGYHLDHFCQSSPTVRAAKARELVYTKR